MEEMYVKSFGMIYQVIPHGPGAKVELRSYDNPEISHRYKAEFIEEALKAGAAGVSVGRNAFQHENPTKMVKALSKMVHKKATVEEAIAMLQS